MKIITQILLFLIVTNSIAQNENYEKWIEISKDNINLQPEYGNVEKTEEQKKIDQEFTTQILEEYNGNKIKASEKMIELGFSYLYERGDFPTAMRRFNQAYLLNPKNADIYYGYGTIYFNLGAMEKAREQYDKGLKINPNHSKILTDYGTTYLGDYYNNIATNKILAEKSLEKAENYLKQSLSIDDKNSNTVYKLAIVNMYLDNCIQAIEYFEKAEILGNRNITESFVNELNRKCKKENIDCTNLKIGKFKIVDERFGTTLITRTKSYQIEENKKSGFKLKLKIDWINDCTYKLKPVADLSNPNNKNLPKMTVTCEIINVGENSYLQISSSDVDPMKLTKKVIILE